MPSPVLDAVCGFRGQHAGAARRAPAVGAASAAAWCGRCRRRRIVFLQDFSAQLGAAAATVLGLGLVLLSGAGRSKGIKQAAAAELQTGPALALSSAAPPLLAISHLAGVGCNPLFNDVLPGRPHKYSIDAQPQRPECCPESGDERRPSSCKRWSGELQRSQHVDRCSWTACGTGTRGCA